MRTLCLWLVLCCSALGADIIAFTRPGCSPCEQFKADIAKSPNMLSPHKVHLVDSRSELARSYGITTVPTFIKLVDGREAGRKSGYGDSDGLKQWADR